MYINSVQSLGGNIHKITSTSGESFEVVLKEYYIVPALILDIDFESIEAAAAFAVEHQQLGSSRLN